MRAVMTDSMKESRAAASSSSSLLQYPFTAKFMILRWGLRLPCSKASESATETSSSRCDAVWRRNNSKRTTRLDAVLPHCSCGAVVARLLALLMDSAPDPRS